MATIDTIKANILAAVPELTSSTNSDLYLKIAEAVAVTVDSTLTELTNTMTVIDNSIVTQRYGKGQYYVEKALYYQEGDQLSIDSTTLALYYPTIDATKHLIQQASFQNIVDSGLSNLVLKVAKKNTLLSTLEKLTDAELSAFNSYMLNFEIVGLPLNITSLDANILNFSAVITYYSSYDLTSIQNNITAAMNTFRDSFIFDGTFYINDLESYLKTNVSGIRNVSLSDTQISNDGGSTYVNFINKTLLSAGYFDYSNSVILTYETI